MRTKKVETIADRLPATVAELNEDIQKLIGDANRLQTIRDGLVELYGGDTQLPELPRAVALPGVQTPERESKKRQGGGRRKKAEGEPATGVPAADVRPPTGDLVKLAAAMRTAPEPFTRESLVVATGLEAKQIGNALFNWKSKGWLVTAARGEYQRTKDFPAATE